MVSSTATTPRSTATTTSSRVAEQLTGVAAGHRTPVSGVGSVTRLDPIRSLSRLLWRPAGPPRVADRGDGQADHHDAPQGIVGLPVPAAVEPVTNRLARRGL